MDALLRSGDGFLFRPPIMKISRLAFNLFLVSLAVALAGCGSTEKNKENKKDSKEATSLRFHLETNADGTDHNVPILIYRARPMRMQIERNSALDEAMMASAAVVDVDQMGGYAIKIVFDDAGKRALDTLTIANKGRHLAIHAQWTEARWLAAPLIQRRMADGVFIFTPDASREECDRIVLGLNNVIKKVKKPFVF